VIAVAEIIVEWQRAAWELGRASSAANLSGEWADDPTPKALYERVTGAEFGESEPEHVELICLAWEEGAEER